MEQRKLMLPAFHGERMERLEDLVAEVTEREVAAWAPEPRARAAPADAATDARGHPPRRLRARRGRAPRRAARDGSARCSRYGDSPMTLFGPPVGARSSGSSTAPGRCAASSTCASEVDELIFGLVDERRAEAGERDDVLSMLLDARHEDGSPMSDQELRDELMTLLVAGHETTATSLAWAFERLVRAPAALERLVAEVDSGDGDAYVTATIQETLRSPAGVAEHRAPPGGEADRGRRLALRARRLPRRERLPPPPRPRDLPRPLQPSGRSASSTSRPAPTRGSRSAAGAGAASAPLRPARDADRARRRAPRLRGARRGAGRPELARRRNITIIPSAGARMRLRARAASADPARGVPGRGRRVTDR